MSGTLHSILKGFIRWIGRWVSAVHPLPILAAAAIAFLLGGVGQAYELYTALLEIFCEKFLALESADPSRSWDWLQLPIAALAMSVLSAYLYLANNRLGRFSTENVFQEYNRASVDSALEFRVHLVGLLAALLPWIGLVYGVAVAARRGVTHIDRLLTLTASGDGSLGAGAAGFFVGGIAGPLQAVNTDRLTRLRDLLKPSIDMFEHPLDYGGNIWFLIALAGALIFAPIVIASPRKLVDGCIALVRKMNRFYEHKSGTVLPGKTLATKIGFGASDWVRKLELVHWPRWIWQPFMSFVQNVALTLTFSSLLVPIFFEVNWKYVLGEKGAQWFWSSSGWASFAKGIFPQLNAPAIGIWALSVLISVLITIWIPRIFKPSISRKILTLVAMFCIVGMITSGFAEFEWAKISRLLGPLPMMIICCLVIIYILTAVALAGEKLKLPSTFILAAIAVMVVLAKLSDGMTIDKVGSVQIGLVLAGLAVLCVLLFLSYVGKIIEARLITGLFMLIALVGVGRIVFPANQKSIPYSAPVEKIEVMFQSWLDVPDRRTEAKELAGRYPVYIVAAEGGGIYAATTVATFLTRMQARCGNFAQHVFAISGVSGGAVGSMIFHSVLDDVNAGARAAKIDTTPCHSNELPTSTTQPAKSKNNVEQTVGKILQDDHLSPLLGLIVPDFLGTGKDRTWGLTQSLNRSLCTHLTKDDCAAQEKSKSLPTAQQLRIGWSDAGTFASHWDINKSSPALVLNTTWANVGNRVVYAPFAIQKPNFDTLNSFGEGGDISEGWVEQHKRASLVEAAVDSARFPGIVPALEVKGKPPKAGSKAADQRWYFVDGGYVDASGTLTAHEIYQSLKPIADIKNVDLKLIILSSTQNNDIKKGADRPTLKDVAAPVEAFFTVRGLLSRIAAKETISRIEPRDKNATSGENKSASERLASLVRLEQKPASDPPKGTQSVEADTWNVTVVELNQDDLSLELGWKISGLTRDMISMQLGHPDLCSKAEPDALGARPQIGELPPSDCSIPGKSFDADGARKCKRLAETRKRLGVARTIRANSCVMASIARTLGAKQRPDVKQ